MTAYRTLLQAGAHPATEARRAVALRAYLRRLAPALTPRWAPTEDRDDFGSALLEIAARLAEETTRRLDRTAERDAIAFFDFLSLPPTPPRAATGVLVMALATDFPSAVFAAAQTQVVVAVPKADGGEATFETQHGRRVIPGRIAELIAVDPTTDRIELAPTQVTSLSPPAAIPGRYEVVSFAGTGSAALQVSPAVGLAAEDVLRIGTSAHRIEKFDKNTGIVTLRDPLEAPAAAGSTFTRIGSLESFNMRNLQRHAFYIGHSELFDLKQPAEISLVLAPPDLARQLTRLDIAYTMYGTKEDDAEPDWHPLDLVGTAGSAIKLVKSWVGTADKVEVGGHKSRWLRAELRGPMARSNLPSRASQVCLTVKSMDADPPSTSDAGDNEPQSGQGEGSRTIARAVHNGTPLSTARRFFPFGPEPLRFDAFALAAPEALSKKGAEVKLDVTMVDSSLVSFEITAAAAGVSNVGGYGVGTNGDLQVVSIEQGGGILWHALETVAKDGRPLLLSNAASVGVGLTAGDDLVVVMDRDGGLWSARIASGAQGMPSVDKDGWRSLPVLSPGHSTVPTTSAPNGRPFGPVLAPAPTGLVGVRAILLDVAEGALHALKVDDNGKANATGWQRLQPGSVTSPVLSGGWQVTPVQGAAWPRRPEGTDLEMVAIDQDGAVWLGVVGTLNSAQQQTVVWHRFDDTGKGAHYPASLDVQPAATRFHPVPGTADLFVAYARPDGTAADQVLHCLVDTGKGTPEHVPVGDHADAALKPTTAIHANPAVLGVDRRPVTVGLGPGPGPGEALIWLGAGEITTRTLPGNASIGRPIVLESGTKGSPEVVVCGTGERIFRAAVTLPQAIEFELHNLVGLASGEPAHWVEITTDPTDPSASTIVELSLSGGNRRIVQGDLRIYQVDQPALEPDATLNYPTLNFLRILGKQDARYTASFDNPVNRAELRLDPNDKVTAGGKRLIIGDASYLVTGVSATQVATLQYPVIDGDASPVYQGSELLASVPVKDTDLGTLADLKAGANVAPHALAFGLGTQPVTQELVLQQHAGGSVWAQLKQAWITAPQSEGWAAVPGSYDLSPWTVSSLERGYQNPELSWEYYDAEGWRRLETGFLDGTNNLSTSGKISFVVPDDLSITEIGGKDDYWIRARLIGGDYGRPNYVVRTTPTPTGKGTVQTVTIDTSSLRPPEILAIEATFSLTQQVAPELTLVQNNLDVLNQTQAAAVPEAGFDLFQGAIAIDVDAAERALYVGLTAPISSGSVELLVDAADREGAGRLRVDLRTADGWRRATADDRTESLRRRGMVSITLDVDTVMVRLFGQDRVWLRLRPEPSAAPPSGAAAGGGADLWAPVVYGLYPNAVEISHARTVENEILGSSLGEPGMTVQLAEQPVLPDTVQLRVRERLSDEERAALEAEHLAATLGPRREPLEQVVVSGLERIPGSWILWRRVDSFVGQHGDSRVYLLDPSSGRVIFGDGRSGKIPPAGRDGIRAFSYQQGGGEAGNVSAWSQAKLTSAVEGVETVVLPVDTAGGFSAPAADSLLATAPHRLRHAGRAMTPADIEALAVTSSADIARAHCARPTGPHRPIRITIAVREGSRPQTSTLAQTPTLAQQDAVAAIIRRNGWGGLADESIEVSGPTFVRVAVTVHLLAPRARLADVEQTAKTMLLKLFHPIDGGPHGSGWPFGYRPTSSDLLRALSDIDGLDRVESIEITPSGDGSLNRLPVDGLVYAEATDITVVVASVEGTT